MIENSNKSSEVARLKKQLTEADQMISVLQKENEELHKENEKLRKQL